MSVAEAIAQFFLYGEEPRSAGARFAHLEMLDDRSRPANWIIRPHAHGDLHHVFFISVGGGVADIDGKELRCEAPAVVIVPAGSVHAFTWLADTEGRVLTFSDAFLRAIAAREPQLERLFGREAWVASADPATIAAPLSSLSRELGWAAAGHDMAVEAYLCALLVEVLRLRRRIELETIAPTGPNALLVARFREVLERSFREHLTVEACASLLAVSPARLRAACRAVAGSSPTDMMHQRLALEAQRVMRYSNMSIAQVAAYLGFGDPAYFSRFFRKHCGCAPRAFARASRVDAGVVPLR